MDTTNRAGHPLYSGLQYLLHASDAYNIYRAKKILLQATPTARQPTHSQRADLPTAMLANYLPLASLCV